MQARWLAVATVAGALALVGCGGDDDDEREGGAARTMAVTLGADGKLQGIRSLEGGPVTTRFTNRARQPYDMQLVRVDGNQTVQQVLRIVSSEEPTRIPNWIHGAGGVGTVPPGQSSSSTQVLRPGRYHVVSAPEGEARPVTASFQVTGGEATGTLPQTTAKIDAFEYSFRASGLKAGSQQVTFNNSGRELHHVLAFPMRPGATLAQVRQFFQREEEGPGGPPPPVEEQGTQGTVVLDGNVSQVVQWRLRPGKYALVCFITDRAGGPPHAAKGMVTEVNVPS
jgi:hypothetical protein